MIGMNAAPTVRFEVELPLAEVFEVQEAHRHLFADDVLPAAVAMSLIRQYGSRWFSEVVEDLVQALEFETRREGGDESEPRGWSKAQKGAASGKSSK
ncbi:MAG: hypothetical protein R3E44_09120 [Paracoccaceae bacterium]